MTILNCKHWWQRPIRKSVFRIGRRLFYARWIIGNWVFAEPEELDVPKGE
jgi:hypothetical protein